MNNKETYHFRLKDFIPFYGAIKYEDRNIELRRKENKSFERRVSLLSFYHSLILISPIIIYAGIQIAKNLEELISQ